MTLHPLKNSAAHTTLLASLTSTAHGTASIRSIT
jgi:hypothetical protein